MFSDALFLHVRRKSQRGPSGGVHATAAGGRFSGKQGQNLHVGGRKGRFRNRQRTYMRVDVYYCNVMNV